MISMKKPIAKHQTYMKKSWKLLTLNWELDKDNCFHQFYSIFFIKILASAVMETEKIKYIQIRKQETKMPQ